MACVPATITLASMARFVASEIVTAGGVDLPTLRKVLPRIDPRTIKGWEAPWFVKPIWGKRIAARAMAWGIYVRSDVMQRFERGEEPERNAHLIVHELTHIEQWRRLGPIRHSVQYVGDFLRGVVAGKGTFASYKGIRLELEARQTARLVMTLSRRAR